MTNDEMLKFALENGIIDMETTQLQIEEMKRRELLEKHPYAICQDKNGKWYTRIKVNGKTVLRKRSSKKEIEDLIAAYQSDQINNPPLIEVFDEWNDRRRDMNKISAASHMRYKQLFEKHYKDLLYRQIKSFDPEDVIEFLEEQIYKYDMTHKAFSNLKTVTKGVFKRAKRRKLIGWNIEQAFYDLDVSDKDFKKKARGEFDEVYTDAEREKMLSYLYAHLDNPLNIGIILLFATGMRVGELMALKPEDIADCNTIKVRRTETCYLDEDGKYVRDVLDHPKTDAGIRTIVVANSFSPILRRAKHLNPFGEYVFEKDGKRMSVRALEARVITVCKQLGIPHKSPHKIRKTYGSILLDNHVDTRMVLDQMGHTDLTTTERFYHRNRKEIDSKISILDTIPEFAM